MIKESFCFLPGVGAKREHSFWQTGIHDWNAFLAAEKLSGMSQQTKQTCNSLLTTAHSRLLENDADWFGSLVQLREQWRLYNHFKDQAVYLDIETDGYYGSVTVVGLYDGEQSMQFVRGQNLEKHLLEKVLARYKMIVTFNGASFDLPILRKYFHVSTTVPHVDLRFVCQRVGITGGLKHIEQEFGIRRCDDVDGMSGGDAVMLWDSYRRTGEEKFLELLLQYNEEDVLNLPKIASQVIPKLWAQTRASERQFPPVNDAQNSDVQDHERIL